jgi:diacylglycerol kinase family enzyme
MQIGVITNPNSRKNRSCPDRAERLQQIVGDHGAVRQTRSTEEIKPALREFLRQRARFWVSDGGDGALHWMLRQGMEVLQEDEFRGSDRELPLALPTNGGSIDFVAHNAGIRGNAESILSTLVRDLRQGRHVEEVEVDSMAIDAVEATPNGDRSVRTLGFAVAAGGVGQRFFEKLDEEGEHTTGNILSILTRTVTSTPLAFTPLGKLPGVTPAMRQYARDMFDPTRARITVDGRELPWNEYTGVHVASMSINLGGVFRFFNLADKPGQMHGILGSPTPFEIVSRVPKMIAGKRLTASRLFDGPCQELTMEATSDELLAPVIDGEWYENLREVSFRLGPRVRIPKVVGRAYSN